MATTFSARDAFKLMQDYCARELGQRPRAFQRSMLTAEKVGEWYTFKVYNAAYLITVRANGRISRRENPDLNQVDVRKGFEPANIDDLLEEISGPLVIRKGKALYFDDDPDKDNSTVVRGERW